MATKTTQYKNRIEIVIFDKNGDKFSYVNDNVAAYEIKQAPNPAAPFVHKLSLTADVKDEGTALPLEKWEKRDVNLAPYTGATRDYLRAY